MVVGGWLGSRLLLPCPISAMPHTSLPLEPVPSPQKNSAYLQEQLARQKEFHAQVGRPGLAWRHSGLVLLLLLQFQPAPNLAFCPLWMTHQSHSFLQPHQNLESYKQAREAYLQKVRLHSTRSASCAPDHAHATQTRLLPASGYPPAHAPPVPRSPLLSNLP